MTNQTTFADAKQELKAKSKEMKIAMPWIDQIPEFATAPVFVQLAPGKRMQVPNRRYTMVTEDNGENWNPVVEVSDRYSMTDHFEVLLSIVNQVDKIRKVMGEPVITPTFQNNGARMFADINFPNAPTKINGDKVVPYSRVGNSADLSTPLTFGQWCKRLVCSNGLMVMDERFPNANYRKRHIGEGSDLISFLDQAVETMESTTDAILMWDGWSEKKVSTSAYIEGLEKIGFTANQQDKIVNQGLRGFKQYGSAIPTMVDCFKKGSGDTDLWVAYNSVTQFITDNTENLKTADDRSRKTSKVFELLAE